MASLEEYKGVMFLSLRNLPIFSRNAQLTYLPQILKDRHAQGY
jgi:hypothetical protein